MGQYRYGAVWVSHSSMGDFLKCPRAYYLHNVYKDPRTGRKMNIVAPAMSLGSAVHDTLEPLRELPVDERLTRDLLADFETAWTKISGRQGGFTDEKVEAAAKARGRAMIERVIGHPGPIAKRTVRLALPPGTTLPSYYLAPDENIVLCGLVDWIEYMDEDDSIHVIDFKTGVREEQSDSLQLPIYLLLLTALQKRRVSGAAYWYLDKDDGPTEKQLPSLEEAHERVLAAARAVKEAREQEAYACPRGADGCFACRPYEAILRGEAEHVGVGGYNQDQYLVPGV
jgi:ATP-dependent helicase/DNAse subunit B